MKKTWQVLNILGFIGVLIMNFLANSLPLAGRSTGEISDRFPTLFTPAGFTFAIWGVIYLLLALFIVWQSKGLLQKDAAVPEFVAVIGPLFFINCLANMAWLLAWHHLMIGLSILIMLVILSTLILIYQRLEIGFVKPAFSTQLSLHWPFSVYLAWISVATIANASVFLVNMQWDGFGISGETWAIVMLCIGALLGLYMLFRRGDLPFALTLVWAYFGIYMGRTDKAGAAVAMAAVGLGGILLLSVLAKALLQVFKRNT